MNGEKIIEFIGLKSKMYSMIFENEEKKKIEEMKTAKGVSTRVVKKQLNHSDYKECLFNTSKNIIEFRKELVKRNICYTPSNKIKYR